MNLITYFNIVTVTDGKIVALKEGNAKVTVVIEGHKEVKAEVNVVVTNKVILVNNVSVNYNNAELCVGETDQLSYAVSPKYTTNVSYTITVSKDGKSQSVKLNALVPGTYN